jgi:hypothetical protein
MFEWQAEGFVRALLEIAAPGINAGEIGFRRRSLLNDAETISNIYKMRGDIDRRTALELNPLIPESRVDAILSAVEGL